MTLATLGGEITVPTLDDKALIDVPEGTQNGKQLRLRGKGIKGVRSSIAGDLYCHIAIEVPINLTENQKKILRDFSDNLKVGGDKHSPNRASWMNRLKKMFG
jgi:molecular chaperone DnaJ